MRADPVFQTLLGRQRYVYLRVGVRALILSFRSRYLQCSDNLLLHSPPRPRRHGQGRCRGAWSFTGTYRVLTCVPASSASTSSNTASTLPAWALSTAPRRTTRPSRRSLTRRRRRPLSYWIKNYLRCCDGANVGLMSLTTNDMRFGCYFSECYCGGKTRQSTG